MAIHILRHMLTVRAPDGRLAVIAETLAQELCDDMCCGCDDRAGPQPAELLKSIYADPPYISGGFRMSGAIWQAYGIMLGVPFYAHQPEWLNTRPSTALGNRQFPAYFKGKRWS